MPVRRVSSVLAAFAAIVIAATVWSGGLAAKSPANSTHLVAIGSLHPTQSAIGPREVQDKRELLQSLKPGKRVAYFQKHPIPVVVGPGRLMYLIDHHHLAAAALAAHETEVAVTVVDDWSALAPQAFWEAMAKAGRVRLADAMGRPIIPSQLPVSIAELGADPYRDLAAAIRDDGTIAKSPAPFAEFAWADFLRSRVSADLVRSDFESALKEARRAARSPQSAGLPGAGGK